MTASTRSRPSSVVFDFAFHFHFSIQSTMAKTTRDVVAFEPADFVIFALLGFVVFYILPKHLLHYYRGHAEN